MGDFIVGWAVEGFDRLQAVTSRDASDGRQLSILATDWTSPVTSLLHAPSQSLHSPAKLHHVPKFKFHSIPLKGLFCAMAVQIRK